MKKLLPFVALGALSAPALAQQTALQEDFDLGIVPPAGWTELNNGVTNGWEPDLGGLEAEHDDYTSGLYNDNRLESPAMDLTTFAEAYLHMTQDQTFPTFRDVNDIDVTLDGGATYTTVYSELGTSTLTAAPIELDLSAYAGMSGVQLSFHYTGDFANVWRLDNILVDDQAPPPPPPYNGDLPTAFVSADCFRENFEATGGVIPAHMTLNALDAATRLPNPEAWANIGQLGACSMPYDGSFNLEFGLVPGSTNYQQVSNNMILGLDGTGVTDFTCSFQAIDGGEELNPDDGIFVSSDGDTWEAVFLDWDSLGDDLVWNLGTCDLASTSVDVSGQFYLMFRQEDNFPYLDLDGVGIDNITIGCPVLVLGDAVAGASISLDVSGADPNGVVLLAYSFNPGPTPTNLGTADIGLPYRKIGQYVPDASGNVSDTLAIPLVAQGLTAWVQGVEIDANNNGRFTNGHVVTVQ